MSSTNFEFPVSEPLESSAEPAVKENKFSHKHKYSLLLSVLGILWFVILFIVIYYTDQVLPTPLTINDEANDVKSELFIGSRAVDDLRNLTRLGNKIVGTEANEVAAVNFLKAEIQAIIRDSHEIQDIQLSHQIVNGSYYLDFKPYGSISMYRNVQNLVVKIEGASSGKSSSKAVLVNAHFDTVPTSPGGSDDGIMCVTMLEILRKLARSPHRQRHAILLLWNGAEELGLLASHGFITQHAWASRSSVLINLEAAGAGGKAVLFQAGPEAGWLVSLFAQVTPRPVAQVIGEEIFQSGLVPSDTDFRNFRDYGYLVGYDFAFARNGYRYHTKYDDFEHIPLGTYQHVGDNIFALLKGIANSDQLYTADGGSNFGNRNSNLRDDTQYIYFDLFGWFIITYSHCFGTILNASVVVLSLLVTFWAFRDFGLRLNPASFQCVSIIFGAVIASLLLSILYAFLMATFLDHIYATMSWYRRPWILFTLYAIPFATICIILLDLPSRHHRVKRYNLNALSQIETHIVRFMFTLIVLVGTIFGVRSTYALTIPVLFNATAFLIIRILKWQYQLRKWILINFTFCTVPIVLLIYQSILVISLFVPITGRMGASKNPEFLIALVVLLLTVVMTYHYLPMYTLIQKPLSVYLLMAGITIVTFILVLTPFGFPYNGNSNCPSPQRITILHTKRTFHNNSGGAVESDSGYFFANFDRNSPHTFEYLLNNESRLVGDDCDKLLLCGLPIPHPKMMQITRTSTWMPEQPPNITTPTTLRTVSKDLTTQHANYTFTVNGSNYLNVYFSPKAGIQLIYTDLTTDKIGSNLLEWNGQKVYFVNHVSGLKNVPLTFTVHFDISRRETKNNDDKYLDIVGSSKFYDASVNVKSRQFVESFPDWADVIFVTADYVSYIV